MMQQTSEYQPPRLLPDSGPPRAIYLAPVYSFQGKQRMIVGERLTSMENPLSADPRDQARYLQKGFKVATKADIQRLSPLDGKTRMFDEPLESLEQLGIVQPRSERTAFKDAQIAAQEQRIAALEAELAIKNDKKAAAKEQREASLANARAKLKVKREAEKETVTA